MFSERYPLEKGKILLPLESLRGIAAVVVSLLHFQIAQTYLTSNKLVQNGDLMVDLFFVLSGFVIAYNYIDRIHNFETLIKFQHKRFWRLYPLHVLTLLLVTGLETARFVLGTIDPDALSTPAFARSSFEAFVSNLTLTQSLTGHINSFNQVSWSISTEFYTYIIAGLLFMLGQKSKIFILCLIPLCGVVLYLISPDQPLNGPHSTFMLRCVYCFLVGVIFFRASILFSPIRSSFWPALSVLLMFASVVVFGKTPYELLIPVLIGLGILLVVKTDPATWIYSVLSNSFTVWLGKISYSIYMIHSIVWTVIFLSIRFLFGRPSELVGGVRYYDFSATESLVITILSLGLLLLVSQALYQYVEVPCNRAKKLIKA